MTEVPVKKLAGGACVIALLSSWTLGARAETPMQLEYPRILSHMNEQRCERMLLPGYLGENLALRLPSATCLMLLSSSVESRTPSIAVPSLLWETPKPPPDAAPAPTLQLQLGAVLTSGDGLRIASLQMLNLIGATLLAEAVDRHATIEKDWRTGQDVLVLRTDLGRFRPFLEMSYLVINPLAAQFSYINGDKSAYYFGGTSYDLGRGFSISAGATVVGGNPLFCAGAVRLAIPLWPLP